MRYNLIRSIDISNGVGIACSVFFQGCSHHCVGCFNPETWDFNGGKEWTKTVEDKFIILCQSPFIKCVSLLGGEPFDQPRIEIYNLLKRIKKEVNKTVFVWSGYRFEELMERCTISDCFTEGLIDVLIDGKFELKHKDLKLRLCGSSNQRIIDIKETLKKNQITLLTMRF